MTNDDRTCGTAAAGPQAEAFEGHGPRLRTAPAWHGTTRACSPPNVGVTTVGTAPTL
jgi:hypothetical protein